MTSAGGNDLDPNLEPQQAVTPAPPDVPGPATGPDESVVRRLWNVFDREPMLLVTASYLFISLVGILDSYRFYGLFDLSILEYMQGGDYFVAGLRRPFYLTLLAWTLLSSVLALWPERWRRRNPGRIASIERHWWGRILLPRRSDWWAYFGLHPETMATLSALLVMAVALWAHGGSRAEAILAGAGEVVEVRVNDGGTLPGDWRLMGTSTAFVFLWNVADARAEVLPLESVASIRPDGYRRLRDVRAAPATAAGERPATEAPDPR